MTIQAFLKLALNIVVMLLPLLCSAGGLLMTVRGNENEAAAADRTDLNPAVLNWLGAGQKYTGILLLIGGLGWHVKNSASASSASPISIPAGLGGIDPSLATIAQAIEQRKAFTEAQKDLLDKATADAIAALAAIKPGGAA